MSRHFGDEVKKRKPKCIEYNIFNIPQERRKLRPNVEAVIKELKEKNLGRQIKNQRDIQN